MQTGVLTVPLADQSLADTAEYLAGLGVLGMVLVEGSVQWLAMAAVSGLGMALLYPNLMTIPGDAAERGEKPTDSAPDHRRIRRGFPRDKMSENPNDRRENAEDNVLHTLSISRSEIDEHRDRDRRLDAISRPISEGPSCDRVTRVPESKAPRGAPTTDAVLPPRQALLARPTSTVAPQETQTAGSHGLSRSTRAFDSQFGH
jgi:hypothetical protein